MEHLLFKILFICFMDDFVYAYTLTNEQNLHTALLSGYNKDLRPGTDRTYPLQVNASFYLFSIKEFDLDTGKLTITGVFQVNWYDERLSWDLTTYNQTNSTSIPQQKLWLPDLINVNPYENIRGLGSDLIKVIVFYTGLCDWYALQAFEVICDADVTDFPFDTQYCTLKFFIWGYQPNEVNVNFISSGIILTLYTENGIWEIADSITHTQSNLYGYKEIVVGLHLKRRTAYYVVSLVLPITTIAGLMGFVFLVPHDSGERLGFSITVLLSIVVYLTIVQDMLPEASEPNISILGYILVSYVLSGAFVVVLVIISLRIQNCPSDKPVPQSIVQLVRCCRRRGKKKDTVEPINEKSGPVDDEESDEHVTWYEVGKWFDFVCFISLIIQLTLTCVTYFSIVLS
ncbi:acetylcholine receptor subunit alpha-like [Saccostrea echinata]|uniref:acetylcholine receptor subunit alpha-like n=1 Tax=Saccostrea echinata TaxID=191078 RepID=UPI002A8207CE|nr:acetylcholine receptor subunit alpha-like [Saccostrea echinata]